MKILLLLFFIFGSFAAHSQQLRYESDSKIFDSKRQRLSVRQIQNLLADEPQLLKNYNSARQKKTISGIMLGSGIGLVGADLALALTTDHNYPSAITYAGVALVAVAIPLSIGNSKKIRNVVTDYNNLPKKDSTFKIDEINFVFNQYGAGFQISL